MAQQARHGGNECTLSGAHPRQVTLVVAGALLPDQTLSDPEYACWPTLKISLLGGSAPEYQLQCGGGFFWVVWVLWVLWVVRGRGVRDEGSG